MNTPNLKNNQISVDEKAKLPEALKIELSINQEDIHNAIIDIKNRLSLIKDEHIPQVDPICHDIDLIRQNADKLRADIRDRFNSNNRGESEPKVKEIRYDNGSIKRIEKYNLACRLDCQTGPAVVEFEEGQSKDQPGTLKSQSWYQDGLKVYREAYYLPRENEQTQPGPLVTQESFKDGKIDYKIQYSPDGSIHFQERYGVPGQIFGCNYNIISVRYHCLGDPNNLGPIRGRGWCLDNPTEYVYKDCYFSNGSLEQETKNYLYMNKQSGYQLGEIKRYRGFSANQPGQIKELIWVKNGYKALKESYYDNGSLEEIKIYDQKGRVHCENGSSLLHYHRGQGLNQTGPLNCEFFHKHGRLIGYNSYHKGKTIQTEQYIYNSLGEIGVGNNSVCFEYYDPTEGNQPGPLQMIQSKINGHDYVFWFSQDGALKAEEFPDDTGNSSIQIHYHPPENGANRGQIKSKMSRGFSNWEKYYYGNGSIRCHIEFLPSGEKITRLYYRGESCDQPGQIRSELYVKDGIAFLQKYYWENGSIKEEIKLNKDRKISCRDGPAQTQYSLGLGRNQPGPIRRERFCIDGELADGLAITQYRPGFNKGDPGSIEAELYTENGKPYLIKGYYENDSIHYSCLLNDECEPHCEYAPALIIYDIGQGLNSPGEIRSERWITVTNNLKEMEPYDYQDSLHNIIHFAGTWHSIEEFAQEEQVCQPRLIFDDLDRFDTY